MTLTSVKTDDKVSPSRTYLKRNSDLGIGSMGTVTMVSSVLITVHWDDDVIRTHRRDDLRPAWMALLPD